MRQYNGYDQAEAFTGDYETLIPGGYICKILQVTVEEKDYGHLMRIGFDIAEGEHKDFYKRQFDRKKETKPDAKWPGMYYQTIKESDLKYFKGFIKAIEDSNSGYKWNWDEKTLKGKLFGGVFGEEEFRAADGSIKTSVKCRFVRSVESVRKGVTPPDIKRVNNSDLPYGFHPIDDDDELPF